MLELSPPHGDNQQSPRSELHAQGVGNTGCRSRDEHPIIGCKILPPEAPVPMAQRHVRHSEGIDTLLRRS